MALPHFSIIGFTGKNMAKLYSLCNLLNKFEGSGTEID